MENLEAFYTEQNDNLKVWGFDLGKGSFGYAVRSGLDFLDVQSLLMDADFAETKTAANNRSLNRLRFGHLAREKWLEDCLQECGIEVLKRRKVGLVGGKWQLIQKGDVRLEKEFPSSGENICYCSIALRCKLILGEKLESWQVFKALNSAIQNRGYDKNIPWKEREDSKRKKEDKSEYEKNLNLFETQFDELLSGFESMEERSKYEYPCFFKAAKMGLWKPENPEEVLIRIDNHSEKAKGYVVPRECVEKEFIKLVEMAALQYPKLAGKAKYFLYGPSEEKYASYYPNLRKQFNLKRGADTDWLGALGQKIPRFDNRIVDKCRLIPRLNVCKIKPLKEVKSDGDLLYYEIVTAFKLLNLRFFRNKNIESLNFNEFKALFDIAKKCKYKVTAAALKKFLKSIGAEILDENQSKIDPPNESGRASFSRPAMKILHGLIFSGKSPAAYYEECLQKISNENPQKGLVKDDLLFLKALGSAEWNSIYIPDVENFKHADFSAQKKEDEINKLIGSQNDPIVRHRLFFFYSQLKRLEAKFGVPDKIVIEFVRDDFLGEKRKKDLHTAMKKRREEKLLIAKDMDTLHPEYKSNKLLLKWELYKKQGGICVYTGEALPQEIQDLEIEHIVPRSRGGPDAMYNYVLTKESTNKEKGDRTPFEWLSSNPEKWASYVDRVKKLQKEFGAKRCKLLVEKDAETLVEKYTALAETAWISKLAQRIACLHFGFQYAGNKGDKKVFTVSGGMTSRIRSAYKLNRILRDDWSTEEAVNILDELKLKLEAKEKHQDREKILKKIEELKSKIGESGFYRKYVDQIEDFEKEILSNEERLEKLEKLDQKNRKNDKHHALDAMCLCFAPTGKDAHRVKLDRIFPQDIRNSAEEFFRKYLDAIIPNNVATKKSRLEETFYAIRVRGGEKFMARKYNLKDLAYTAGLNPKYSLDTLQKLASGDDIINESVRNLVRDFLKTKPGEDEWKNWCENLRLPSKFGEGTRVKRVLVKVGKPDEYKDLSKDGSGAYKRGKTHKGQIVWKDSKGKYKVAPIYAHSSKIQVMQELKKRGDFANICGVFKSGCLVEFDRDVANDKNEILLEKGIYTLIQ